jgi:RNA polymerase-binding transcription factor DksA
MVAKKTAAKKATAAEPAAKKAARTTAKTEAAKESPAKRTPAKKAERAPAKKTAAKKTAARKTPARKAPARRAASAAKGAAQAAEQTGAKTVAAKKTAGGRSTDAAGTAGAIAATPPGELAVRPGEDPWTPEEVAEARAELEGEVVRLNAEITTSEQSLVGLMRDSGDGAGDDDADTGTKNITREHEMSLAANAREMLEQTERALQRLDAGTYGLCEICGKPIGKARMQAFPRATLCVEDKQKQERRG